MIPHLFDSARDQPEALSRLHGLSFPDAWSAAAIADLLASPGTFAFQLQDGFILARVAAGEAEILTLAVAPAMRGRGLGRTLLAMAARHAQTLGASNMFLEVGVDNPPALALYAGQGFVRVGQRKAYYGGGDALIMKAQLPLSKNSDIA
jgi:ribosomal-protein-alanine N-acetyltransferase